MAPAQNGHESSRKRSRPCDDDACDFTPISKRINNLHIRSGLSCTNSESPQETNSTQFAQAFQGNLNQCLLGQPQQNPQVEVHSNGLLAMNNCLASTHACASPTLQDISNYSPELTVDENPHYYQINRLLFELHINRLQRLGKQ